MNARRSGILILFAGAVLAALALRFGFNPCLVASVVIVGGMLVIVAVVSAQANRRLAASRADLMRAAQMCPSCGYTIRAQTDRCPECGTPRLPVE